MLADDAEYSLFGNGFQEVNFQRLAEDDFATLRLCEKTTFEDVSAGVHAKTQSRKENFPRW